MATPLKKSLVRKLRGPDSPSGYPKDWGKISAKFRELHNYTCKECGVDCSEHHFLIDVHHIDSDKSNCDYSNLQCLCKYHHSKQPQHEHYSAKEYMGTLHQLWEEQDISIPNQGIL